MIDFPEPDSPTRAMIRPRPTSSDTSWTTDTSSVVPGRGKRTDRFRTDSSASALAVALTNVRKFDLPNVTCVEGDWTAPVADQRFRIIVSNPPYVAEGDAALETLSAEPDLALTSGKDGLDAIRRLAAECLNIIDTDGMLLLEHGNDQAEAVEQILEEHGWRDINCVRDYAGHPRMTTARPKARQHDHN